MSGTFNIFDWATSPTVLVFVIGYFILLRGWLQALYAAQLRYLHYLQLDEYNPWRLLRLILMKPYLTQPLGNEILAAGLLVAGSLAGFVIHKTLLYLVPLSYWLWGIATYYRANRNLRSMKSAKKPLVMTTRARRILIAGMIVSIIAFLAGGVAIIQYRNDLTSDPRSAVDLSVNFWAYVSALFLPMALVYFAERLSYLFSIVGVLLLIPLENSIQKKYIHDAKARLGELKPLIIGITGSYGKTSTKEILSAILGVKYNIFKPPGSYNTLMGVTRVIRESLRPFHEAFIVEMGAYRRGSIAKLCRLTKPRHGIITTIGVQHLERFKTVDRIRKAKGELAEAVPSDGVLVLNGDNDHCREIGNDHQSKVVYFSTDPACDLQNCVIATDIDPGLNGTTFKLKFADGEVHDAKLSLLGRAAVSNAIAAAALADELGVDRENIVRSLANLPHVKHRLEPILKENGVTVLDDAYNSNPIGAANALEVLAKATTGKRILVTPGMVELGKLEAKSNREFGRQAAEACDLVVLVGSQITTPIYEGLKERNFPDDKIYRVASLNEGIEKLRAISAEGDTMLLENDLPDQYN